jgi:hypothetical protein
MALGVVTELAARTLRLWIYHKAHTPVLNVIVMFGLIMGGLASRVRPLGLEVVVVIAFAIGLLYEVANLRVLKWWYFPSERLAFIRGHAAIVVVLALLWAAVPAVIVEVQGAVQAKGGSLVMGVSRLDRLNQRERQLTQKLDALHERARAVETQLEDVRMLKQTLLGRRAVRELGPHDNPPPTP